MRLTNDNANISAMKCYVILCFVGVYGEDSYFSRDKVCIVSCSRKILRWTVDWFGDVFPQYLLNKSLQNGVFQSEDGEMDSSSNWMRKLLLRTDKDTSEKLRRKEERKLKEDEKKKQKEEVTNVVRF